MLNCVRRRQVVNTYLETVNDGLKGQMEAVGGQQEEVREQAGALQGVDLFEAQQALKEQPQVRDEMAQLRNELQTLKQQAAEVPTHCYFLPVLMPALQHVYESSQQAFKDRERLLFHDTQRAFQDNPQAAWIAPFSIRRQT